MGLFDSPVEKTRTFADRHQYAGDFEIVDITDAKGRTRKRALYRGTWTALRPPEKNAKIKLWATLALALALAIIYGRMVTLTHLTSGRILAMLPLYGGMLPGLYLLMGAASLPFTGRPMRRDQYMHSFIRVSRSAAAVIVCVALGIIVSSVYRAIDGNWSFFPEDRLFLILCFLILGTAAGTITLLRTIDLMEKENGAYPASPL